MSQATDGAESTESIETEGQENSFDEYDLDYTGDSAESEEGTPGDASPADTNSTEGGGEAQEQVGDAAPASGQNLGQVPQQPPLTDVEALQARVNELMGKIAEYEQQKLFNSSPAQVAQAQVEKEQAQAQGQPSPMQSAPEQTFQQPMPGQVSNLDFLGGLKDQDYIDFLGDPSKFNEMLNKVATVTYNAAVTSAQEQIMMRIPQLVQNAAQQQMSINNITQDFYAKNADLKNFRQAVSMAAVQLYNENPKLQLPELLAGAAKRTREILHLAQPKGGSRKRTPAQPAGGSVRSSSPNRQAPNSSPEGEGLTDQQRQIMELLNF